MYKKMNENDMGWAYGTKSGEKKYIEDCGRET
jgi:hypothetical protein